MSQLVLTSHRPTLLMRRTRPTLAIVFRRMRLWGETLPWVSTFNLRKEMFGAEALGARNVEMIDTARGTGSFAKFTGSGGAAVVLCATASEEEREAMYADCEAKGFKVCPLLVNPGKPSGGAA